MLPNYSIKEIILKNKIEPNVDSLLGTFIPGGIMTIAGLIMYFKITPKLNKLEEEDKKLNENLYKNRDSKPSDIFPRQKLPGDNERLLQYYDKWSYGPIILWLLAAILITAGILIICVNILTLQSDNIDLMCKALDDATR